MFVGPENENGNGKGGKGGRASERISEQIDGTVRLLFPKHTYVQVDPRSDLGPKTSSVAY